MRAPPLRKGSINFEYDYRWQHTSIMPLPTPARLHLLVFVNIHCFQSYTSCFTAGMAISGYTYYSTAVQLFAPSDSQQKITNSHMLHTFYLHKYY